MLYIRVYAPDGEPFDVIRDIADNLLLNEGWTQSPVVDSNEFTSTIEQLKRNAKTE